MDQLSETFGGPSLDEVPSLWERFDAEASKHPNNVALVCTHQPPELYNITSVPLNDENYSQKPYLRWTYKSLKNGISHLVAGLRRQGVGEGSPIFTFMPNMAESILTLWAADRLGCSYVPINPRNLTNKGEVTHMIVTAMSANHSTSAAFIASNTDIARQIEDLGLKFPFKLVVATTEPTSNGWTSFSDAMICDPKDDNSALNNAQHLPRTILFTSGTTSLPKGCQWVHPSLSKLLAQREYLPSSSLHAPGDVVCVVVPNNHAIGYLFAHFTLGRGATIVYPGPAFSPQAMMDTMHREKCTHTALVPLMVHALLGVKAACGAKLGLKSIFLGGSMVSPENLRQCAEELGSKGVENAYGMTEGAVIFPGNRDNWMDLVSASGKDVSIGWAMAGQKIRICAPGTRIPVKRDQPGELHVSCPILVSGYIGKQSDEFYVGDDSRRWFVTGDMASMDHEGRIFIVGRYKEMIIRGGENVSPAAIEAVLGKVPKLAALEPQVVGVPDHIAGEVPVAVIKSKVDADTVQELHNTILTNMGSMYIPDEIISLETLGVTEYPKTMAGKIQKTKLTGLVCRYRDTKDTAAINGDYNYKELEASVKKIWSQAVGYEIDLNAPVSNFADSITVMKARDRISKETGRTISLSDMVESNTVAGQIKLLQTQPRQQEGKRLIKRSRHEGPPGLDDVFHLASDPSRFESTKTYIEKTLSSYNLAWADVEDVVPAYDFAKTLAQTGIFDSWGFKFAILPKNMTTAKLRTALEATLVNNRLMASFLLWDQQAFGTDIALHIMIKHRKALFDCCITHVGKVETVQDLKDLAYRYPNPDHATVPGPLIHAAIAEIEETGTAGLVMSIHHAVVDASYGLLFFEDFDKALGGAKLEEHIDYKPWADSYFALRTSMDAKIAVAWHVWRLKDLDKHVKALMPPRGARSLANGDAKPTPKAEDSDVVEYTFRAPSIPLLRHAHPTITAPIILKSAIALLDIHLTKHTHALFANLEASRLRFPFVPRALDGISGQAFEATDVAGPTIEAVTNLIEIRPEEPVLEFLTRMQDDQSNLTKYAAAPLCEVIASLGEQAGPMVLETLQTQIFNWVPGMGVGDSNPFANFQRLSDVVRPEIGLVFNAGLGGKEADTVFLHLRGTAYRREELKRMGESVGTIVRWLTARENWEERVGGFEEGFGAAS